MGNFISTIRNPASLPSVQTPAIPSESDPVARLSEPNPANEEAATFGRTVSEGATRRRLLGKIPGFYRRDRPGAAASPNAPVSTDTQGTMPAVVQPVKQVHKTSMFRDALPELPSLLQKRFPNGANIHVYGASHGDEVVGFAILFDRKLGSENAAKFRFIASDYEPQVDGTRIFDRVRETGQVVMKAKTSRRVSINHSSYMALEQPADSNARFRHYVLTEAGTRLVNERITFIGQSTNIIEDLRTKLNNDDFRNQPQVIMFRNAAYLLDAPVNPGGRSLYHEIEAGFTTSGKKDFSNIRKEVARRYPEFHNARLLEGLLRQCARGTVVVIGGIPQEIIMSRHVLPNAGFKARHNSDNRYNPDYEHRNTRQIFIKTDPVWKRILQAG